MSEHRYLLNAARRWLVQVSDAEDAVQDTYLKTLTRWPDIQAAPRAWMQTVLRNLAIDMLRRHQLESGKEDFEALREESPEARLERDSDCRAALRHLLSRTTPVEGAALLLRDVFEFEYSEIGEILFKQDAATRQFLHRARLRARSGLPAADADDAVVALCARALECRAPELLIDMIQTRVPCMAQSITALAAPLGLPKLRRSSTASSQLLQVNGRYVMALVLDGVVLCIVPVGVAAEAA